VDLFFVISGFLITRILLNSRGSSGYYKSFYSRRILRIWPLYFFLLLLCISVERFDPATKWWAYPLFIQNLVVPGFGPTLLIPTWSLAIEEQFYAAWPILVSLLRPRVLVGLAAAAFVSSAFIREYLFSHSGVIWLPYINTFGRLDGLALGALLAIAIP
jgi:peptidoglycan/LPS O-acetylase OafA/YrhL